MPDDDVETCLPKYLTGDALKEQTEVEIQADALKGLAVGLDGGDSDDEAEDADFAASAM